MLPVGAVKGEQRLPPALGSPAGITWRQFSNSLDYLK